MKNVFSRKLFLDYKKRLIATTALAILVIVFNVVKSNTGLITFYVTYISGPFKQTAAYLLSFYYYSFAEIMVYCFFAFLFFYILFYLIKMIIKKDRLKTLFEFILNSVFISLLIYTLLTYLWGANYYSASFKQLSGITTQSYSVEQLYNSTLYFTKQLVSADKNISRNQNGTANIDIFQAIDDSQYIFDEVEKLFPFLEGRDLAVKPVYFSEMLSRINTTGIAFPFTGEANVNIHSPACLLPSTMAHEISHQRNVASEDEANFVGILSSVVSGNDDFVYSGYLSGYIYLSNALYRESPELFETIYKMLPSGVIADLRYINEYWDQYDTPVSETSEQLYDDFLKSYDQELGVKSYGAVVDLLIEYYNAHSS